MTQDKDSRNGVWVCPMRDCAPLIIEFGLELDASASNDNTRCHRYWDEGCDAFKQDWTGLRIWSNPPYGRAVIYRWVKQFSISGAAVVVALLPARTDTRWFHDFIYNKPNVEIRFLKGRIKFSGMKGSGKFPSMICIFKGQQYEIPTK